MTIVIEIYLGSDPSIHLPLTRGKKLNRQINKNLCYVRKILEVNEYLNICPLMNIAKN